MYLNYQKAEAKMENGLLTITVPYSPQSITNTKSLEIK